MFKNASGKATNAPENPYVAARREWADRYGDLSRSAGMWRMVAFGALAVAAISAGGLATVASQVETVPFIVQVDKLGTVLPVERADQAARPDQAVIRAQLAEWLVNVRTVSVDPTALRRNILKGYALIDQNGPAFQVVNEHMSSNDPFRRARDESVAITVNSVLPVGAESWRVEWTETTRGSDGQLKEARPWQAVVTTKIVPPRDEAAILANPLGLYVHTLSWSPRV